MWIWNPMHEEMQLREALADARRLSERESRAAIDDLFEFERKLPELRALSEAYERALDELLPAKKLSEETASTLSKVRDYLAFDGEPLRRPSFLVDASDYGVVFRKGCYFFFGRPRALDVPGHAFFGVEKAKLGPEQIEFLDRKCKGGESPE